MKLPAKIQICGKDTAVKLIKGGGGWFNCQKRIVAVGKDYKVEIPEVFMHETCESILAEMNLRYALQRDEPDNGDYIFVMNHEQFQQFVKMTCAALRGISFPK